MHGSRDCYPERRHLHCWWIQRLCSAQAMRPATSTAFKTQCGHVYPTMNCGGLSQDYCTDTRVGIVAMVKTPCCVHIPQSQPPFLPAHPGCCRQQTPSVVPKGKETRQRHASLKLSHGTSSRASDCGSSYVQFRRVSAGREGNAHPRGCEQRLGKPHPRWSCSSGTLRPHPGSGPWPNGHRRAHCVVALPMLPP